MLNALFMHCNFILNELKYFKYKFGLHFIAYDHLLHKFRFKFNQKLIFVIGPKNAILITE